MDRFVGFTELDICLDGINDFSNKTDNDLFQFDNKEENIVIKEKSQISKFNQCRKVKVNRYNDDSITAKFGNSKSKINFDNTTILYYKSMRKQHCCPLSSKKVDPDTCFKLYDMWDPYTGERLGRDPYGPLCFDIDTLIKYIYNNRLRKLWVDQSDGNDGVFEGYYDDAIGAGDGFFVTARGHHPEWDIFRIPIIDCYLTNDHNNQHITFGPKLTDEEIANIDYIANNQLGDCYLNQFRQYRPSLMKIKHYYDIAISKTPPIIENNKMTDEEKQSAYNIANREAVIQLRKMKG
jgi:hypothetical protein